MEEQRYAAVICPKHGQVFLTCEEYDRQLCKPDSCWTCPAWEHDDMPGICGMLSDFDDDFWEEQHENQSE